MDSNEEVNPLEEAALSMNDLDKLAYTFQNSMKRVRTITKSLSKKAVDRANLSALEYPFSKNTPVFRNKLEKELFTLTLSVQACKGMMMGLYNEMKVKQTQEETPETNEGSNPSEQSEEINGEEESNNR